MVQKLNFTHKIEAKDITENLVDKAKIIEVGKKIDLGQKLNIGKKLDLGRKLNLRNG